MMMDNWFSSADETSDDMAKNASKSAVFDEAKVSSFVTRLIASKLDKAAFDGVVSDLNRAKDLTPADIVEIAQRYRGGGSRPTTKKAAFEVIAKRHLELVRNKAQIEQAKKARPW